MARPGPWPGRAADSQQTRPVDFASFGPRQTTTTSAPFRPSRAADSFIGPGSGPGRNGGTGPNGPYHHGRHSSTNSSSGVSRFRLPGRMSDFDILENLEPHHGAEDSSSSDEGLHPRLPSSRRAQQHPPPPPPRPTHGRSMSHPFPSLFPSGNGSGITNVNGTHGPKKKQPRHPSSDLSDSDSDSDSDAFRPRMARPKPMQSLSKQPLPLPPPPTRGHRAGPSAGSKDFTTGNCMTCGSLVRWPRELQVFKCTICMTVNDLQPGAAEPGREGSHRAGHGVGEESSGSKFTHISLEHTRSLVQKCLRSHLAASVRRPSAFDSPEPTESEPRLSSSPDGSSWQTIHSETSFALRPKPPSFYVANPFLEGHPEPTLHHNQPRRPNLSPRAHSTSYTEGRPTIRIVSPSTDACQDRDQRDSSPDAEAKRIFKPVEDYVVNCFNSFQCLNLSFGTHRSMLSVRHTRDAAPRKHPEPRKEQTDGDYPIIDLDPKLLLLGDFAENGSWWTGGQEELRLGRTASHKSEDGPSLVSIRNPRIAWNAVDDWYNNVLDASRSWRQIYDDLIEENKSLTAPDALLQDIEAQIIVAQEHLQRTLLKATENLLKRPGRIIKDPSDLRFLLIISANPLLHASYRPFTGNFKHPTGLLDGLNNTSNPTRGSGPASGRHSGIIKRVLGLMSNAPADCHSHLISWFSRFPESLLVQLKDLVGGFLAYRLVRQNEKKTEVKVDVTDGLIPSMSAGRSAAALHAALGQRGSSSRRKEKAPKMIYQDDWQIKAASQVMAFIFSANNSGRSRHSLPSPGVQHDTSFSNKDRVQARGQMLATSDFYVTLLDDSDLVADFEAWERKRTKFSFCQYPFLLSIGAKIQILEHDARRQMQTKARDAFFDSIMTRRNVEQFLILHIRRECLVEDSLKAVSEVIGSGGEDIKKGLRIIFTGEEGVDAGGLRKEWFLLLVREVFNPDHGMFIYDEDSKYCYFNPNSLEPSEQFFLVGVVFGLAIYNSTILDVALPPFAFRKLLMAAPPPAIATSSSAAAAAQPRPSMTYTLDDLAEYRPRLAHGLRQLLDYDGPDVETTFCLDFVIDTDRYGVPERTLLCPGGDRRPVTATNRREYVDLYVRHVLDTQVARQFEPFKRGFFTVCGGNALSLFRPEEIELLVRGSESDEALDVGGLKAAATYTGWELPSEIFPGVPGSREASEAVGAWGPGAPSAFGGTSSGAGYGSGTPTTAPTGRRRSSYNPAESEPTVRWFWESFERASPRDQRRLLLFVTGSDRIPAMGAASLQIRISCLGDDCGRFPTARTCFNVLALWRCRTRERLEKMLWTAVHESEGFGLK